MVTVSKKIDPKKMYTKSDTTAARVSVQRAKVSNSGNMAYKAYQDNYPGKDPAKQAGNNVPPVPGGLGSPERNRQMDLNVRMIRDTTMSNNLSQARNNRLNTEAGMRGPKKVRVVVGTKK
jgi:uncharacterized membrane protein YebE (DUF533 family)